MIADKLQIQLNFSKPLRVSYGKAYDIIHFEIINENFTFISYNGTVLANYSRSLYK